MTARTAARGIAVLGTSRTFRRYDRVIMSQRSDGTGLLIRTKAAGGYFRTCRRTSRRFRLLIGAKIMLPARGVPGVLIIIHRAFRTGNPHIGAIR